MAATGYYAPVTVTQTSQSLLAWLNPTNVTTSDNAVATAALTAANAVSETLLISGFSLAVPVSVVSGIEVSLEIDQLDSQVTVSAQLLKYGVLVGQAKTTTSSGLVTLGSASDLWGTTLVQRDVQASNFGVGVSATYAGAVAGTVTIDQVRIRGNYAGSLERIAFARPVGTM